MATVAVAQQTSGEILISRAGDAPDRYVVSDGRVDVPDQKLPEFLAIIGGNQVFEPAAPPPDPEPVAMQSPPAAKSRS